MLLACFLCLLPLLIIDYVRLIPFSYGVDRIQQYLKAPGLGLTQNNDYTLSMWEELQQLICRIENEINILDTIINIKCQYAGSVAEGTKVGFLDEIDIQLCVKGLRSEFFDYHYGSQSHYIQVKDINTKLTDWRISFGWQHYITW